MRFARAARHFVKADADFREVLRLLPEIWDGDTSNSDALSEMIVPRGLEKELREWESAEEMSESKFELQRKAFSIFFYGSDPI